MKEIHINILAVCLISVVLLSACSVTKHLPEGSQYKGVGIHSYPF